MMSTHIFTIGMGCVLLMGLFSGCSTQSNYGDRGEERLLNQNPLNPCPDSPNCVRESREVNAEPQKAFDAAVKSIEEMDGKITEQSDSKMIESEFKAFVFTDDFDVAVTSSQTDSSSAVVHIRSASRVGHGDLGVNPKRVEEFWNTLTDYLD